MKFLVASIFGFVCFINTALAQDFDVSTIPDDYSFVSHGTGGITTITYLRPDGETYLFNQSVTYLDGSVWSVTLRVNRQSQTVSSTSAERMVRYSPHDCAPSVGQCNYRTDQDGFVVKNRRDTKLHGDVFVINDYRLEGGVWLEEARSCATFDQYGFWVDYYMIYPDGSEFWGIRDTPNYAQDFGIRLERLKISVFHPKSCLRGNDKRNFCHGETFCCSPGLNLICSQRNQCQKERPYEQQD